MELKCELCGKTFSNVAPFVSHCRAHVKKGEMIETKDTAGKLVFKKSGKTLISKMIKPTTAKTTTKVVAKSSGKLVCACCNKTLVNTASYASHCRAHVKKNEMTETRVDGKLIFKKL